MQRSRPLRAAILGALVGGLGTWVAQKVVSPTTIQGMLIGTLIGLTLWMLFERREMLRACRELENLDSEINVHLKQMLQNITIPKRCGGCGNDCTQDFYLIRGSLILCPYCARDEVGEQFKI